MRLITVAILAIISTALSAQTNQNQGLNKEQNDRRMAYQPPVDTTLLPFSEEKFKELEEVVITATRTSRAIDNVPVPVQIIKAEEIEQIGSVRLNEVLLEQTGLQIVSDHGTGLQMQGLNADYIMILIDGEPVVGRTAGTLDLTRLAVDNIERVEIIKGPSSSLYGSEAMAGVVNIITKGAKEGLNATVGAQYRSFGTTDLNANLDYANDRLKAQLYFNRLGTDGYDLTEESVSMTAPPFEAYTFNPKFSYRFSDAVELSVNGRFYTEAQENMSDINLNGETVRIDNQGLREDWNVMPTLKLNFHDKHSTQLRSYTTGYRTETQLSYQSDGAIYDESYFDQTFNRSEVQHDWYMDDDHILTIGLGHTVETVEATRYADVNSFQASYAFLQHQWTKGDRFNLIVGGRFDDHSEYASRFSPKISAGYEINEKISVRASFGGGFKAPDFRQLLLDFTNPIAGYSVLGAAVVQDRMAELTEQGQIANIFIDPNTIEEIEAETSLAYNLGIRFNPTAKLNGELNLFRNDISNLIEASPIARKTNGQNIFSYFNFDEVITQGVEVSANYQLMDGLQFSVGYQYLDSRNVEDIERINNGVVFRRNPSTGATERVTLADYGGLPNRSRHSGNAKVFYSNNEHKFDVSLRAIYRGRWGLGDNDGNMIIDNESEYSEGYVLLNFAVNKELLKHMTIEAGVNNLLGTTNTFEPSIPGRIFFGGVQLRIFNN